MSDDTLIKTNMPGLYRDLNTGAIINMSSDETIIKSQRTKSKEIETVKRQVNRLTADISEVKDMLKQLMLRNT